MDQLADLLKDVGLSEREAKVYLSSLALGPTTVLRLSKHSGVHRTTTYSILESLQDKGLISKTVKGRKELHTPQSPERLEFLLENRKKILRSRLPELEALYSLRGKESIITYERGMDGIEAIYESFLKDVQKEDFYRVVGNTELLFELEESYFRQFIRRRAELYSKIELFLRDNSTGRDYKRREKEYNIRVKLLPDDILIESVLVLTPRKAVIHQLLPPYEAIVLENQSVIELWCQIFESFWRAVPD